MESSGVPTQGIVLSEATTAKRRGDRGKLGLGTAGSRLKTAWRAWNAEAGAPKHMMTLRPWVRKFKDLYPDAIEWAKSKGIRL